MRRVRGNSRIISRAWDLSWCVHLNTHRFETLLGIVTWLKKICIIWRFYILPNPLSLPLLIEFNVFPLESSTRLQERRFCYSSSKGERICGYRRKLHIHWQHSQKLWKIVGKIWRVSLETSDTDSIWTRISKRKDLVKCDFGKFTLRIVEKKFRFFVFVLRSSQHDSPNKARFCS